MLLLVESIFISSLLLCASIQGASSSKVVTLESIQIFVNHNFLPLKPTVYFKCQGEKVIILPDVKQVNVLYKFKGEESWQPLTELPDDKCKRCGVYQTGFFKADDVFDEWELCLDDFVNGTCTHMKEYQFKITLRFPENETSPLGSDSNNHKKHGSTGFAFLISIIVIAMVVTGLIAAFKYWQKKKREQDQARFLKMFEEVDDMEDELGLGPL